MDQLIAEQKATFRQRLFRVAITSVKLEIVPSWLRVKIMRYLGCDIADDVKAIWSGCVFKGNLISLRKGVFINSGFFYDGMAPLQVEENVAIGPGVMVITGSHEISDDPSCRCSIISIKKSVTIKRGCWIGAGVVILPGIVIAEGCVIGARAVMTKNTEPNGLYIGNPAFRVRDI